MTHSVEATLNYLADSEERPVLYASRAGPGLSRYTGNRDERRVTIHDARPLQDELSLDRQGFVLLTAPTAVADLYDDAAIETAYGPEVEALIQGATGAAEVRVFDHTRRSDSAELRAERKLRDPAGTIHNDYTARSGPRRLRDLLPAAEAEARLARRFAIVNLWRPIRGPVVRMPLAMCDAGSVAPADLVASERRAKDRIGEIHQARFKPNHRWFYFPDMGVDEVLLFKTFDSATDGRARFTIHSAFEHPDTPVDAPPRESIESRAFVFF